MSRAQYDACGRMRPAVDARMDGDDLESSGEDGNCGEVSDALGNLGVVPQLHGREDVGACALEVDEDGVGVVEHLGRLILQDRAPVHILAQGAEDAALVAVRGGAIAGAARGLAMLMEPMHGALRDVEKVVAAPQAHRVRQIHARIGGGRHRMASVDDVRVLLLHFCRHGVVVEAVVHVLTASGDLVVIQVDNLLLDPRPILAAVLRPIRERESTAAGQDIRRALGLREQAHLLLE